MAEKTQMLSIVTPQRVVYGDEVRFVSARGVDGDLGVLPEHTPLITGLKPGVVRIQKDGKWTSYAVAGGFLEVRDSRVVILANAAESPDLIDVKRAEAAKQRAEERLASKAADIDLMRAKAALMRALARLDVAQSK
ncbi:MAG: F0F1 ATP synthase subunit epsilon [Bacillota bacterium]|nr:F0F1 ATP synthase subunit epsilon [Desulforudis sp.]MDZ7609917.1 F0F1 ATP synthase subunit epsilon [Eubacteriales bacterium]